MSIQRVNKAVEHLINSTPVLGRKKRKEKKKQEEAVNVYLIKNSNIQRYYHKQSEGMGGVPPSPLP